MFCFFFFFFCVLFLVFISWNPWVACRTICQTTIFFSCWAAYNANICKFLSGSSCPPSMVFRWPLVTGRFDTRIRRNNRTSI
uniref:Putative secreted protein salivary gland overexpressed n=1 Tax=Rhipicephalus microplus TaxID=6941 RepID=A0A6M2DE74_RHIMP